MTALTHQLEAGQLSSNTSLITWTGLCPICLWNTDENRPAGFWAINRSVAFAESHAAVVINPVRRRHGFARSCPSFSLLRTEHRPRRTCNTQLTGRTMIQGPQPTHYINPQTPNSSFHFLFHYPNITPI